MEKIRFGAYVPIFGSNIPEKLKYAVQMERSGFDSVWVGDHLMEMYEDIPCEDPWCILSALAMKTKNVILGTCVTDPHRRHPAVLAQALSTVDQISDGRVILGLGAGEAMNLTPFGIPWDRPISRMREAVEILKRLLTGETVTYNGRFYQLKNAFVRATPVQKPHPPIYLAGGSPRSRKLAGLLGDGWITLGLSPEILKKDLKDVEEGARRSGRGIESVDVVCNTHFAVSDCYDEAREAIEGPAKLTLLSWPQLLRRYGYVITNEFNWLNLTVTKGILERVREYLQDVPSEVAELISIYGTPDDCIDKIKRYVDAGATHLILNPQIPLERSYKFVGERVIPYFREK